MFSHKFSTEKVLTTKLLDGMVWTKKQKKIFRPKSIRQKEQFCPLSRNLLLISENFLIQKCSSINFLLKRIWQLFYLIVWFRPKIRRNPSPAIIAPKKRFCKLSQFLIQFLFKKSWSVVPTFFQI